MEVLDDNTHEHVEDEEAHQQQEWDKVEQSPLIEVLLRLKNEKLLFKKC
jgi:hypothetical protein